MSKFKLCYNDKEFKFQADSDQEGIKWVETLIQARNEKLRQEEEYQQVCNVNKTEIKELAVQKIELFKSQSKILTDFLSNEVGDKYTDISQQLMQISMDLLSTFEKWQLMIDQAESLQQERQTVVLDKIDPNDLDQVQEFYQVAQFNPPAPMELSQIPYREQLPAQRNPKTKINVWQVIKDCLGKDLSKISVPVYFNEPISFLQRFAEDLTFKDILSTANNTENSCLRCAYVGCFMISTYAVSQNRTLKPFNPVLGETFEVNNREMKIIAEQVSHHPPISAIYCETEDFIYEGFINVISKFKGNSMNITPKTAYRVFLKRFNEWYTFEKPLTTVMNIVIGKVWLQNHGQCQIRGESNRTHGIIEFDKQKAKDRVVSGQFFDENGEMLYRIEGVWSDQVKIIQNWNDVEIPVYQVKFPENYEWNYYFSEYTLQLNHSPELYEGLLETDSRFRQDQRAMENGDLKLASQQKQEIEQYQRELKKLREENGELFVPRFFEEVENEWRYKHNYY